MEAIEERVENLKGSEMSLDMALSMKEVADNLEEIQKVESFLC